MDRTKEVVKAEEEDEKKEHDESMDKSSKPILTPLITTCSTTNSLVANTDDDTSTESSDTFESWTLVSDKQKFMDSHVTVKDNDDNRIEVLKNSEPDEVEFDENERKTAEQQHLQDSLKDVTNDDFSDGISIISESESVGRISPHPYVRGHLQDLNLQFSTTDTLDDDGILYRLGQETPLELAKDQDDRQLRHRHRSSATVDPPKEEQALEKSFQTSSLILDVPAVVKRGLQGIFFVGVALAILAIIGKILHPTWQPLAGGKPSSQLEQKLNDMELQNNLMRAEIDLLNKQVKYLSSFKEPQQHQLHKGKYKEEKTFKVWSGNGDSLKPVIITKEDLKRPYKCPDGSYVEIANMCLEQRPPNEPSLVDQFGQVVGDMKQQSETFKTLEKVAEELHRFQNNEFIKNKPIYQPSEDVQQKYHHQHKEFEKPQPKAESRHHHKYDKSQEGKKSFGKDNKPDKNNTPPKNHETYEKFQDNLKESLDKLKENFFKFTDYSKETFDKFQDDSKQTMEKLRDNSKEVFEKLRDTSKEKFKKIRDDSKETFKKLRDGSKETFKKLRDISKEQFEKLKDYTQFRGNYKEKQNGRYDHSQESKEKSSKERFNRHKQQNNDNNNKDSGEWQEKYMQHREKQRKRNEDKYQNQENWYIKRGDSRENKRSGEKQYR